jgi:hypothetical protein
VTAYLLQQFGVQSSEERHAGRFLLALGNSGQEGVKYWFFHYFGDSTEARYGSGAAT